MYIVWRCQMYYFSEWTHIYYYTDNLENAIKECESKYPNIDVNEMHAALIEFNREESGGHYISEIPFDGDELYVLQIVDRYSDVKIMFDDCKANIDKELELLRKHCKKFTYDDCFYSHDAITSDGIPCIIYEYTLYKNQNENEVME